MSERPHRSRALPAAVLAVLVTAMLLWSLSRLTGVPYNVVKLMPAGAAGLVSALGLAAVLWWLALGLFMLFDPRRRAWLLLYPLALLLHGAVAWALLRSSVPLEMIHKIIGEPVLGLAWPWEDIGRYLALHLAVVTQLLGAMLCVRVVLRPQTVADLLYWLGLSLLLAWPLYDVVVAGAATDNLVALMRHEADFGAASAMAGGLWLMCLSGCAFSAALCSRQRRRTLLALCVLAGFGATGLFWLGHEPFISKYGTMFSTFQFILSANRERFPTGIALAQRYTLAFIGVAGGLALMQCGAWWRLLRDSRAGRDPLAPMGFTSARGA